MKILGIVFTCLSIFVLFPLIFFMKSFLSEPYEKYDFDKINKNGTNKIAKVINIATVNNVSVNGKNPFIITYQFEEKNQRITDKCQTFDINNAPGKIEVGSEISVKYYNNESVPIGIKPYRFPISLFYILPVVFLLLGLAFWFISYKIKNDSKKST